MSPYFYNSITLLGGITLFLYGLAQATDSFRSAFSTRTRKAISRFTRKKIRALLFGAVLSAIAQGSTVSTSIAIGLVDVGMLTLTGSAVVMMGASIGGTFVTLLVSLDIVKLSPLFMAVSFSMARLGRGWVEKTGQVLHAVSLLLVGMFLIKLGIDPLLGNPAVRNVIVAIAAEPFAMFFAAFAGTSILQDPSSVLALTVAIAASGALPQSAVFPVVLGSHFGSGVIMLLAASGGRRNARVLGIATFLYKMAGAAAFVPLVPWMSSFLDGFAMSTPVRIVLSQALVVIFNAVIFYPWPQALIRGSVFVLSRQRAVNLGAPIYLDDNLLEIPPLAVKLLSKEMIRLTNYIEAFLQIRLYPEKGGEELKKLLPAAITELTETCENYTHAIHPPAAEDPLALLEYRAVTYAMLSLREASRITTGPFRSLVEGWGSKPGGHIIDEAEWNDLESLFMKTLRDAFHAFSLGDGDLAQRAIEGEAMFEKAATRLRSKLLKEQSGYQSSLLDFIAVAGRLVRAALDVAKVDVLAES